MQALFKHAKNFVGDYKRPIFEGIYFDGENAIVSNTFLAVIVKNQPVPEKRLVHWKTGQLIDGNYPDVVKLIPAVTQNEFYIQNIAVWLPFLKNAVAISKKNVDIAAQYPVTLTGSDKVIMKTYNPAETYAVTLPCVIGDPFEIRFNVKHLHDIFSFFREIGATAVTWGFNAPNAVMKLTTEKGVLAVVTQIYKPNNEAN